MSDREKTVFASLAIIAIGFLAYWAYDAQVRVDEYNSKVKSLTETVISLSAKQSADQESNLKDLEDNKVLESKVQTLEVTVAEQQTKISELESKLSKKKK
jgi:hypothetical protein